MAKIKYTLFNPNTYDLGFSFGTLPGNSQLPFTVDEDSDADQAIQDAVGLGKISQVSRESVGKTDLVLYDSQRFLSWVSPTARINAIQAAAAAYLRSMGPGGLYPSVRWCTPTGAGAKDGLSLATAWSPTELAANTTSGLHVYMQGVFEPASATATGPVIRVKSSATRLDFATYAATVRGFSGASWTASGVNGEYYTSVTSSQPVMRLTENGVRMRGTTAADCGVRCSITAIDATLDTITIDAFRPLAPGDKLGFVSSASNGLSPGVLYYVKTVTGTNPQTLTLSIASDLSTTVDITGVFTASKRVFCLANGRYGDPVAGSLQPGEFCYVPWEARVYIKPSSGGVPNPPDFTVWATATEGHLVMIEDPTPGNPTDVVVVGGKMYGAPSTVVIGRSCTRPLVIAVEAAAAVHGIVFDGATAPRIHLSHAYDVANHLLGSLGVATAESAMVLSYNWAHDSGQHHGDAGDFQGLVTNPSCDGTIIEYNVLQRSGRYRTEGEPVGLSDILNYGAIVIDSSQDVIVRGNYVEECPGEQVGMAPNDVKAVLRSRIVGNIFDLRRFTSNTASTGPDGVPTRGVSLEVSVSGTFAGDTTNLVAHNLFILGGNAFLDTQQDSGVFCIRNASPTLSASFKARNNLVVFTNPGARWQVYYIRRNSNNIDANTHIDSDNNIFVAVDGMDNLTGATLWRTALSLINVPLPDVSVPFPSLDEGWAALNGSINDSNSKVLSPDEFLLAYGQDGSPIPGGQAFTSVDAAAAALSTTYDGTPAALRRAIGPF